MNAPAKIEPASLLGALATALPELEGAKKNAANPHFKSKYADLGSILDAIRPIAEHGLWFRQVSQEHEGGVAVETFYIHEGGELSAGVVFVPADKKNAQGYGSAQTYARRYGLQLAFGLATEDDDGNAATATAPKLVSDNQWAEIVQLIEATGTDAQKFCQAFKIGSVKDLPADAFPRAKAQLTKKLETMKEKADV